MTAPTAPRRVRLAVWATAIGLAVLGLSLVGAFSPGPPAAADVQAAEQVLGGDVSILALHGPAHSDIPELSAKYDWSSGDKETIELLPAWRWSDEVGLFHNDHGRAGLTSPDVTFGTLVGSAAFGFAAFVWKIVLAVLKLGLTTNVAASAGEIINHGYLALTESLITSGMVVIVLIIGLVALLKAVVKVQVGRALRLVMSVLIPLGLMIALGNQIDPGGGAVPAGSPAWLADRGVTMVDEVGVALGSGFGVTDSVGSAVQTPPEQFFTNPEEGCAAYTSELYGQYERIAARGSYNGMDELGGGIPLEQRLKQIEEANAASATNGASRKLVATVSLLWQRGFMDQWNQAQFGTPSGHRAACYQLESINNIPPAEQRLIDERAQSMVGSSAVALEAYQRPGGRGDQQAWILAFAFCDRDGSASTLASDSSLAMDDICSNWASSGYDYGDDSLRENEVSEVQAVTVNAEAGDTANNREMYRLYHSLNGQNTTQRAMGGVMAAISALIYLYALGGLAIGSLIAQFGLVILLILLPVTLTLMAAGAGGDKGGNPLGKRLLKMTLAFFGAKLGLTVVLTMLMQTIVTLEKLLASSGQGMSSIMHMLIPLVALALIRQILKATGFGDLTNLKGSVGMATSAAMASGGPPQMSRATAYRKQMANKLERSGPLKHLGKFDDLVKRKTTGRAKAAAIAAGAKSKELAVAKSKDWGTAAKTGLAAAALGTAAGLDSALLDGEGSKALERTAARARMAKEGLLGSKDAEGNRVADGVLQRAASISGLLGLGAGAKNTAWDSMGGVLRKLGADVPERDEDKQSWADKFAGNNPKRAQRHQLRQNQARMRQERAAAIAAGATKHPVLDENGNPVLDENGNPRYASKSIEQIDRELAERHLTGSEGSRIKQFNEVMQMAGSDVRAPHDDPTAAAQIMSDNHAAFVGTLKDAVGYERTQLLASPDGLAARVMPTGRPGQVPKGRTVTATVAEARNPVHYLPQHVKEKRAGESDLDYAARLDLTMAHMGLMDPTTGEHVDYLEMMGIDPDTEYGRQQVELAAEGKGRLVEQDMVIQVSGSQEVAIERSVAAFQSGATRLDRQQAALEQREEVYTKAAGGAEKLRNDGRAQAREVAKALREISAKEVQLEKLPAGDAARVELEINVVELRQQVNAALDPTNAQGVTNHLVAGREQLADALSAALIADEGMDSGERNAALKMNAIDTANALDAMERAVREAAASLESASGRDAARACQDLRRVLEGTIDEQFDLAVATDKRWAKAKFSTQNEIKDRRLETAREEAKLRNQTSRTRLRNLREGAQALPGDTAPELQASRPRD